jgi:cytochrome c5
MTDAQITEHASPDTTAKEAIVIILLTIVVFIVAILLIVKLITGGLRIDPDSMEMSEEAIAKRLKPVGEVSVAAGAVDASADAAGDDERVSVVAASVDSKTGAVNSGEQVYDASCQICHAAGVAGAPKVGDKAAWKARIAQGVNALYASAIDGKNTMPPKGGAMGTSDDDIKAAVDLMIARSK